MPVKAADAPGARLAVVNTVVLGPGRSLDTTMLVKVTSPVLLTVPPKVAVEPGDPGSAGQVAVTAMRGVVRIGQIALAESETAPPQRLFALAVNVSDTEQFVGAR